jgi:hypothetical protein
MRQARFDVSIKFCVAIDTFRPSRTKEMQLKKITVVINALNAELFLMACSMRIGNEGGFIATAAVGMEAV